MADVLLEEVTALELLETAEQGPPGPPGPAGGAGESAPVMTYAGGVLVRVDYASGNYKTLTYDAGRLSQLDYVRGAVTTRKTLTYNPDGTLASVAEAAI